MRAVQFVFSHALFAAICAVALCFETVWLIGLGHDWYLYAFVFFATLGSYNFHLLMGALYAEGSSLKVLLRKHIVALGFMIVSAIVLLCLLPKLWHVWPYLLIAAVATASYSLVLLPVAALAPLRRVGFAKTLLLALTWTFVTALLPLQKSLGSLQPVELVFILQRFFLILQLCLLFDLRDTAIDKIKGLHSLATDMSPVAVQWFFYILAGAYLLASGFLALLLQQFAMALAFLCVQIVFVALCQVPMQRRSYLFYYFFVDGVMLLSVLLSGLLHWLLAYS
jgi:hypothetical protein